MTPIVASILPPLYHIAAAAAVKVAIFCYLAPLIYTQHTHARTHTNIIHLFWHQMNRNYQSWKINRWKSHNVKPCQEKNKKWKWWGVRLRKLKTHFHCVRRFLCAPIVHIFQWHGGEWICPIAWLVSLYFLVLGSLFLFNIIFTEMNTIQSQCEPTYFSFRVSVCVYFSNCVHNRYNIMK